MRKLLTARLPEKTLLAGRVVVGDSAGEGVWWGSLLSKEEAAPLLLASGGNAGNRELSLPPDTVRLPCLTSLTYNNDKTRR